MSAELASILAFYQFPTSRRMFALREVKKIALAKSFQSLANHCDAAIAHDTETRGLEARYQGQKNATGQYHPLAKSLDGTVDIALTALHDALEFEAKSSRPGDPLAPLANELRIELYPNGVGAITSLNYVAEVDQVDRILKTANNAKWAPVIQALGLSRRIDQLAALEPEYRQAIADPGVKVEFETVRQARKKGQSSMLEAVAMVLGKYPSDSEPHMAARTELLAPIFRQNEAIREYLRLRSPVAEVDPETGEPEAPAAPPAAESPTG